MKIQPPKNFKFFLGDELEAMADNALTTEINKAIDFIEDTLKQIASQGNYAVSIYHSDISEFCGAKESRFRCVMEHVEKWLIEQGVQIISITEQPNTLHMAWGVGKYPEGFKSMAIEGVRG